MITPLCQVSLSRKTNGWNVGANLLAANVLHTTLRQTRDRCRELGLVGIASVTCRSRHQRRIKKFEANEIDVNIADTKDVACVRYSMINFGRSMTYHGLNSHRHVRSYVVMFWST